MLIFGCNKKMALIDPLIISVPDTVIRVDNSEVEELVSAYVDYGEYEKERLLYERLLYERLLKEEQELKKQEEKEKELKERQKFYERLSKNYSSPLLIENKGTLVYKVDEVLIIGVASRVEARIIKQVSQETTDYLVSLTTHTTTGIIYEEVIKVGNIMDMDLKSLDPNAFTINKITDDEQIVDENDVTYWLWSVTANKVGNYNLIMTAKIKDNDPSRNIIIFDKQISVMNKPKKKFSLLLNIPDNLKRYDEGIIKIDFVEKNSDTYSFEWGGEGNVIIDFDGKVDVITDDNIVNDKKPIFNYKWVVTPKGKEKVIPFTVMIVGDYENLILFEDEFIIEKNFKKSFNNFIDGAVKRWYWLFTALLIPLVGFIKKKYFKKKSETN